MIYKRYNFTVFTTIIKKKKDTLKSIKVVETQIEVYAQSIKQAKKRLVKMGLNAELKHD